MVVVESDNRNVANNRNEGEGKNDGGKTILMRKRTRRRKIIKLKRRGGITKKTVGGVSFKKELAYLRPHLYEQFTCQK